MTRFYRQLSGTEKWLDYPINWVSNFWRSWLKPYNLINYLKNFNRFNRMAWEYKAWDSWFSIEIFCELLECNARACHKGYAKHGEKSYKRGMAMSGYLRKAYLEHYTHPTLKYLFNKNKVSFKNGKFHTEYHTNREMYDKLWKLASTKEAVIEQERKDYAWQYVNKYIGHLWD